MTHLFTAILLLSICHEAHAQIGIGQCQWQSDGNRWILTGCTCADNSVCEYPTNHPVPPAGITQQFPARDGATCTPALTAAQDMRLPYAVGSTVFIAGIGISYLLARKDA